MVIFLCSSWHARSTTFLFPHKRLCGETFMGFFMNSRFDSGLPCVFGSKIQVPAVIAFTLFISQQPAHAGHHAHMHHGGGQNINRLLHANNTPKHFRHQDLSNRQNRIESNGLGFQTTMLNDVQQTVTLNSGINLDLGSQTENITLGAKLFEGRDSVKITVGGAEKTLQAGSQVTAAEYLAAKQVLSGAAQSLVVGADGSAAGGRVDFGAIIDGDDKMRASSLVNPAGVTVAGDFGKRSEFQLRGDLTNFGSVNAYSSNVDSKSGTIRAHDIYNEAGATISSSIDLRLRADNDLNNYGAIESNGSVTLSAGHAINNVSTITAQKDVSLDATQIVNRGQISSTQGNINLDATSALTVDNRLGLLRADNGAINVRSSSYDQDFDTFVCGGDLVSSAVNLNSGQGLLTVDVGQLTGVVTQKGTAVHMVAATDDLVLGQACLTGDPTFYNQAGNITVTGDINVSQALTIVASGNIVINGGADLIAGDFSQGFPITLIAGANITATAGGANVTTLPPLVNSGGVTINGGSAGGGIVNIAAAGTVISTQAQSPLAGASTNGADVLLVAFGGATAGSGTVTSAVPTGVDINTGGTVFGDNGNITVIAPGNLAPIVLPNMTTVGGDGFGGQVVVTAADPIANNVVYLANGNLSFGGPTIQPAANLRANGQIQFGGNQVFTSDKAFITASADNLVQLNLFKDLNSNRVTMICPNGKVGVFGDIQTKLFIANADSIRTDNGGSNLGSINSPKAILTSTTGDIGNGTAFPFVVDDLINGTTAVFITGHDSVSVRSVRGIDIRTAIADGNGAFFVEAVDGLRVQTDVVVTSGNITLSKTGAVGVLDVIGSPNISTANGSITIQSAQSDILLVSPLMSATTGVTVQATTSGNVNILDAAVLHTDAGNVNISTISGAISIGASTIDTDNGNINIVNSGTDKKLSTVTLSGTVLSTLGQPTNGDITISVGTPGPNVVGKTPKKNITITPPVGGTIFFGAKGITTNAPNNTLTVINADIIFNNPISKKNIVLSGVNITADPPSTSASASLIKVPSVKEAAFRKTWAGLFERRRGHELTSAVIANSKN